MDYFSESPQSLEIVTSRLGTVVFSLKLSLSEGTVPWGHKVYAVPVLHLKHNEKAGPEHVLEDPRCASALKRPRYSLPVENV